MQYFSTRSGTLAGILLPLIALALFIFSTFSSVAAQEIRAEGVALLTRAAPGETLPLSVKLVNFGGNDRVDVTIFYEVSAANGRKVVETSETVAVETTASFVKNIVLPKTLEPGRYTAQTRILYDGQQVPATATYQFDVERKIFGVFISEFLLYTGLFLLFLLVAVLLLYIILRKRHRDRLSPRDYSNVPRNERIYYEIIGDAILQMRYHEGDKAIDLAVGIQGLVFDAQEGRIVKISGDPAAILAELVRRYNEYFGKKVSFSVGGRDKGKAFIR